MKNNRNNLLQKTTLLAMLAGLVFIALYIALSIFTEPPASLGILFLLLYAGVCAAIILYDRRRARADVVSERGLGNIMLDTVTKMRSPILICDGDGKIVWVNQSLRLINDKTPSCAGRNISEICSLKLSDAYNGENGELSDKAVTVDFDGRGFDANFYPVSIGEKRLLLIMFSDLAKYGELYGKYKNEHTVVAYIVIDNLEELMQYVQEKYRDAASSAAAVLQNYAAECGGILKEYERDKYLLIFTRAKLLESIKNDFPLLEEIKQIRIGDSGMALTVSMGVADIDGALAECERAAHSALDMALQRGGDQVALRRADGYEYFGGRSQSVQKRTKVRARVIAGELVSKIAASANVIIMGHKFPDFDCIGAALGIARLSMFCGVRPQIVIEGGTVDGVIDEMKKLPDYEGVFISGDAAMELKRTGTLLILVDVNNFEHTQYPALAKSVYDKIIIDHHRKTAEFDVPPLISYIEPSASSASELVGEILEQSNMPEGKLLREEAEKLFAGILLDTKQFTKNTGTKTFSTALYLRGEGASPHDALKMFKTNVNEFVAQAKFETNVTVYRSSVAIAVSDDEGDETSRVTAAKVADKLLSLSGVTASFAIVKIGNAVHISGRSSGETNVQIILERVAGKAGGGSFDSAAAALSGEGDILAASLGKLKEEIDAYLDGDEQK